MPGLTIALISSANQLQSEVAQAIEVVASLKSLVYHAQDFFTGLYFADIPGKDEAACRLADIEG